MVCKNAAVDNDISYLTGCLHDGEQAELDKSKKQPMEFERELFEQKLQFKEMEMKKQPPSVEKTPSAKLPKLNITKFNRKYVDWKRFWNQFTEEIDKTGMAPITKFSYLKEFVEPKVRRCIDGLPFNAKGTTG